MPESVPSRSSAVRHRRGGPRGSIVLGLFAGGLMLFSACDRDGTPSVPAAERGNGGASPMYTDAGGRADAGGNANTAGSTDADGESGGELDAEKQNPARDLALQKLDSGLNEANRALKAGRYADCRKEVEAYLKRAGASARPAQAEFMIGLSYHRPRIFGEARPHFARAIEIEPGYVATYYFYGYCLFNLGRLDEADAAFATYLKAKPNEADAIFGQGLVALEADRVDDADRSIRRAIEITEGKRRPGVANAELDKDLARYQSRLADVYLRRDDLAHAKQALERAIVLWPEFFESWNKLHKVLTRLGETAAAEKALAKYQELFERRQKGTGGIR